MNTLDEREARRGGGFSSPRVKVVMLHQMAEALEDQAAGLYRRAAAYEEEEFLLSREISERQTEINRLTLKAEAMRSERDGLLGKIEAIRDEVAALREEAFRGEEDLALEALNGASAEESLGPIEAERGMNFSGGVNAPHASTYFRRVIPADAG